MKEYRHEYLYINTKDIVINPMAQRRVDTRNADFNKIMKDFNPNVVNPIKVAFFDGVYYCYDGQMTMEVLKAQNGGKDLPVECRAIYGVESMDVIIDLFICQNGHTSPIKPADIIRTEANKEVPTPSKDFLIRTKLNGFRINSENTKADIDTRLVLIKSTTALQKEYDAFEDKQDYEVFLRVLDEAFKNDSKQTNSKILGGLGLFMRTYKDQFDYRELIKSLKRTTANEIIKSAEADKSNGMRKYAIQILQAYNYRRTTNRLENIL